MAFICPCPDEPPHFCCRPFSIFGEAHKGLINAVSMIEGKLSVLREMEKNHPTTPN